ncbi:hypothetical protein K7640_29005 [Micromonospora sp. PLK6-60]|uniref:hypothetical protein n=1 Tax=Micromonospora sp. PLK6-60 TaxID=2873383 RepID=UPI001CA6D158|nr:hypothetical protein [Micromonospora sp. PLK6-60]MBY8875874.1 hypothetical protein [Micromonospora sp. PLK6-60]
MGTTTGRLTARPSVVRDLLLVAAMTARANVISVLVLLAVLAAMVVFREWVPFLWFGLPITAVPLIIMLAQRPRLRGHAVRPAEEPELATLVRQVAERLGFRSPLLLRIVAEPDANVLLTKTAGFRTYTVFVGLPLLRQLSTAELAALLAREFAREQHVGDWRTRMLFRARYSLVESVIDRRFRAPAVLVVRLLRASQARLWPAALVADAEATAVAGTQAMRDALTKLGVAAAAFDLLGTTWLEVLGEDGSYPEDLYEALDAAIDDPHVAARLTAVANDENDPMAIEVEPPLGVRLAALPEHLGYGWDATAPVALRDADALRRWCVREVTGSAGRRPVRLLDLPPERFEANLEDDAAHLMQVTGQDSAAGAVRAAADAVADGTWMRLARALDPETGKVPPPMRAPASRAALTWYVGGVISGLLLAAGWTRASRWTVTVLVDPAGAPLDVEELVEQAVDSGDPTRIRELLADLPERAAR